MQSGENREKREKEEGERWLGALEVCRMDYRGGKSIRSVKFRSKVVIKDQRVRRLVGRLLEYVLSS